MKGAKDAAMVILGLGGPQKKGRRSSHDEESEHEMEEAFEEDYLDSENEEYSDEQLEMAGELRSALDGGDEHDILTAIHGIVMSYNR